MSGAEPPPGGTTNVVRDSTVQYVVQADVVQGGIHIHPGHPARERRLGPFALVLAALVLLAGAALLLLRGRAGGGLGHLALAGGALLVLYGGQSARTAAADLWWARRDLAAPHPERDAAALEYLAAGLLAAARREERVRLLQDPFPLPVRWENADPLLADHWEVIRRAAGPAPEGAWKGSAPDVPAPDSTSIGTRVGTPLDTPIDLSGDLDDIGRVFDRVPSRRLVVVGRAGSGKSVLGLVLTLQRLTARRPGEPVPVLLPLGSWNPLHQSDLWAWAADRIAADHPGLSRHGRSARHVAVRLLRTGRILPVLDGMDEIPEDARAHALATLNATLGRGAPVLLTSREEEYRAAIEEGDVLTAAAVVAVQDLRPADVRAYLPLTTRRRAADGGGSALWDPVLARLAARPPDPAARPLAEALSTPLMVALAREAYGDGDADPAELLATEGDLDRAAVERHLLAGFVPAAYRRDVSEASRDHWSAEEAATALRFLIRHTARLGTQDIAWWQLYAAVPLWLRALWELLPYALSAALLCALRFDAPRFLLPLPGTPELPFWSLPLVIGLLPVLRALLKPAATDRLPSVAHLRGASGAVARRLAAGCLAGALVYAFAGGSLALAVCFAAAMGCAGFAGTPADPLGTAGSGRLLRADRRHAVALGWTRPLGGGLQWLSGLLLMLPLFSLTSCRRAIGGDDSGACPGSRRAYYQGVVPTGSWIYAEDFTIAAPAWLLAVLGTALLLVAYGVLTSAWGRYGLARLWLNATHRLRGSPVAFLEDAHRRGVLRQSGSTYRLRHARVEEWLIGGGTDASPRPPRARRAVAAVRSAAGAAIGVVSLWVVLAVFFWSTIVIGSSEGLLDQYSPTYFDEFEPCELLDVDTVRTVVPGARPAAVGLDCTWNQGPGPDRAGSLLALKIERGTRTLEEAVEDPYTVGRPEPGTTVRLTGLGDEALLWSGPGEEPYVGSDGVPVEWPGAGAVVFVRSGHLLMTLGYVEEDAEPSRVRAVVQILASRLVEAARERIGEARWEPLRGGRAGAGPGAAVPVDRRDLGEVPRSPRPPNSRFNQYRDLPVRTVVGGSWAPGDRTEIVRTVLPFVFRVARGNCDGVEDLRGLCQERGDGAKPPYFELRWSLVECPAAGCGVLGVPEYAELRSLRNGPVRAVATVPWRRSDATTWYYAHTTTVSDTPGWPRGTYYDLFLAHVMEPGKAGGARELLLVSIGTDAAHAADARKTANDIRTQAGAGR